MENEVHTPGSVQNAVVIPHIANVELELGIGVALAHVILFFLIPAEDTDFFDIGIQEAVENSVAEGAGAAGDEKAFILKQKESPDSSNVSLTDLTVLFSQLSPDYFEITLCPALRTGEVDRMLAG